MTVLCVALWHRALASAQLSPMLKVSPGACQIHSHIRGSTKVSHFCILPNHWQNSLPMVKD